MPFLAVIVGIYSYSILLIGILGYLNFEVVFIDTLLFLFSGFLVCHRLVKNLKFRKIFKNLSRNEFALLGLLAIITLINIVGALGSEIAFDALWYHLTIPKLFLLSHKVYFIHGNLFYYSLMPKLTEMLYAASIVLSGEILAKVIHFSFGILTCIFLYKLSRLYLTKFLSLLVVLIFYSNLVVGWLSITAYSDLVRSFYEIGALYYFVRYLKSKKIKLLILCSILLGFAISTKLISIGSVLIFAVLLFFENSLTLKEKVTKAALFTSLSLSVSLPWFLISFYYTKNPFFPLFTQLGLRTSILELLAPLTFLKTFINIFLFSPDPVNPFYILVLPVLFLVIKKIYPKYKLIIIYSFLSYFIWYLTSQAGGARFLTAYLPAYSVLGVIIIKEYKDKFVFNLMVGLILLISFISIFYRGAANARYVPVILGIESKQAFLMNNLNFSFGDFYDENSDIKNIVGNKMVLLINMHNLYYVDFPYILPEWNDTKKPLYILVQNGKIPSMYKNAELVYTNSKTKSFLYKL